MAYLLIMILTIVVAVLMLALIGVIMHVKSLEDQVKKLGLIVIYHLMDEDQVNVVTEALESLHRKQMVDDFKSKTGKDI